MTAIKKGVVIGKFMPLHNGHVYMLDFARNFCDELTILVDNLEGQTIDPETRADIVRKTFPQANVTVKALPNRMPQDPSEHPDFWQIWKDGIESNLDCKPNYILGAMDYIKDLAKVLDTDYMMIDKERTFVPVSATMIRNDPFANWGYIAPESRSLFTKRICIIGGESTGKTTLAKALAKVFDTTFVPEYARTVIEENEGRLDLSDYERIAYGQKALNDTLLPTANKVIFHDTDFLTTKIWSEKTHSASLPFLDELIRDNPFDLYLVTDNSVGWEKDDVRFYPEQEDRDWFLDRFLSELEGRSLPYLKLKGGSVQERVNESIKEIRARFFKPGAKIERHRSVSELPLA